MRKSVFILFLFLCGNSVFSQVVIRTTTTFGFSTSERPDIVINSTGDINTNGTTDFANAKLHLNLVGGNQNVTGNLFVTTLRLLSSDGSSDKTINNTLTISDGIEFTKGILRPGVSGKILFKGDGTSITGGNTISFVDGPFFQTGGGYRFFPLGHASNGGMAYAPLVFENAGLDASEEMSVEAFGEDPSLTFIPEKINAVDNTRYWAIATADVSKVNSRVSLGIDGLIQNSAGSFAVVQAGSIGGEAESLGFSFLDPSLVTSRGPVTKSILAIGVIPEIVVLVHDLITPYIPDGANDKLTIDQLDQYDFNTVTMLDRWGVVVKRWENFTNEVEYDFSNLSPGSYIIVVEFGNHDEGSAVQKVSQMVTVLKTN